MKKLADSSHLKTLTKLTINFESAWFEGRDECLTLLLEVLARQVNLQELYMHGSGLSEG